MNTKHTPGPWIVRTSGEVGTADEMLASVYPIEATRTEERRANAAFIVRACNSHDDLLAALEKIAAGDGYYGAQAREYKEIARSALAKINK